MSKLKTVFFLVLIFLTVPSNVKAQVVINEFSPASDTEWVELFNKNSETKSLTGYSIFFDNNPSTTQKYQFCDNDQIAGVGYRLVNITSHYLNNSGDTVILKIGDDVVDSISYGSGQVIKAPTATQSATRNPDGGDAWIVTNNPSPRGDVVSFVCPTPTPTLTPNPTSIPTLSPTQTPTVAPTPTPTKTPTPKSTLSPSPNVLGEKTSSVSSNLSGLRRQLVTPSPSPEELVESEKNFPIFPAFLIVGGFACLSFAGFSLFRKIKSEYNKGNEEVS